MKSNFASRVSRFLVVTLMAIVFAPQFAHADSSARGKFTLASPARWGLIVLPAGTYSYEIDSHGPASFILVSDLSGRSLGFVVPQSASMKPDTDLTSLQLKSENAETYVSSMTVGDLGLEFYFTPPSGKAVFSAKGSGQSPQAVAYSAAK